MNRCALGALVVSAAAISLPGAAQVARNFPADALRGEMAFGQPPEVVLNGQPARLGPGARIRGADNLLQMSAALAGSRYTVHYTVEIGGLIKDVWLLTDAELARKPWPRTPEEAKSWRFDPIAQTWTRP